MQVSVETGEGLERKLTVQVPAETLEIEVENRLKTMMGRVKVDGFRPGKVPLKVVKQRYGAQVFHEVAGEVMQNSLQDALTQENLRPASEPSITTSNMQLGSPLEFTAVFEVFPEVTLNPVSNLKLEKIASEVTDKDVDGMMDTLRKQRSAWKEVDRASANGDRITIDFVGRIDGEKFAGGSADNTPVVLGSGSMIPDFERQLSGLSKSQEQTIKVKFPDDYLATDLAGKKAEFDITVRLVEEAELPELNEEFAKSFGIQDGDLAKLIENVRDNMERELEMRVKAAVRKMVMDKLLEANSVDVPTSMVTEEAESLKNQAKEQQMGLGASLESYMEEAERRVKLGIIMVELMKESAIQVDTATVEEKIEMMSRDYEDPAEFVRYYKNNPQLMRSVESMVLEEMIVDWVMEQANVTTVNRTFDEIVNNKG